MPCKLCAVEDRRYVEIGQAQHMHLIKMRLSASRSVLPSDPKPGPVLLKVIKTLYKEVRGTRQLTEKG